MKESEEYNEKLQQWLEGRLSDEEWQTFKASNQQELTAYERIAQHTSEMDVPASAKDPLEIWQNLEQRLEEEPSGKPAAKPAGKVVPFWRHKAVVSIAASALLLAVIWFSWPAQPSEIYSAVADQVVHELPDQSKVTLNADSKIGYLKGSFDKQRTLSLQGEAFFEVKSGSKFRVESALGSVEVLGTAFNVFARDDRFEVVCMEGKVQVTTTGDQPVVLQAGDAVSLQQNKLVFDDDFNVAEVLAWQQGTFYFKNATLPAVIQELERQFDFTIQYPPELEQRRYTGFFTRANPEDALASVFEPLGVHYQMSDKVVVVE